MNSPDNRGTTRFFSGFHKPDLMGKDVICPHSHALYRGRAVWAYQTVLIQWLLLNYYPYD
ncbi:MAG: hypothetical protein GKR95_25630 [Gammaproteobacteria bacterium]|nr:hypothetical protein [Gammaproteobacteria bacterium]NKB65338.1 hypothetical protein [Gammaproteobacteria bacterium]